MRLLLASGGRARSNGMVDKTTFDIAHAALVSDEIVEKTDRRVLPQIGLLGEELDEECTDGLGKPLFVNTNIPLSAFICGVQGSGKSHTTACLLENWLIKSKSLGHLAKPLSALVFHYSELTSNTVQTVSESAFLATLNPDFPGERPASKVTVLVPDTNYYNLCRAYSRVPNVEVQKYKIKSDALDIGTMLTLMAFDQSQDPPLYMAQVKRVLMDMATESSGGFDYEEFQDRVDNLRFTPAQKELLNQRLYLLKSFLDLDGTYKEPRTGPGEVVIMDLSSPFMDANTACVLFRIGMKRYLESSAAGKVVVLDEAHKVGTFWVRIAF